MDAAGAEWPDWWPPRERLIDLGDEHWLSYYGWAPDRDLNPQYDGIPDIDRYGAVIYHRQGTGAWCMGSITFDTPEVRAAEARNTSTQRARWQVKSWEPLTITPSVLCKAPVGPPEDGITCDDHGSITNGRWVRA